MAVVVLVVSVAVVEDIASMAMSVLDCVVSAVPVVVMGVEVLAEAKSARRPPLMAATDGGRDSSWQYTKTTYVD